MPFSDDNHWKCGDLVRICTAGGGGWGDPLEREAELVLDDVKDGFVSMRAALDDYGVVIDAGRDDRRRGGNRRQAGRDTQRPGQDRTVPPLRLLRLSEAEELEWVNRNIPR